MSASPRKRVVLLGATGSIGESTLRVIAAQQDRLELVGIAAHGNHVRLAEIARRYGVRHVGLYDPAALTAARSSGAFPAGTVFHGGAEGLSQLAALPEADVVLVAIVGTTALQPTLAAIAAKKTIALASKEILVLAGKFVMAAARASGSRLLPVDSEHNAVFQCLEGHRSADVSRLVLTASGGAFRDWPLEKLAQVTPADALKHPNWAMGPKITVDSATLANKGLELIEAQCLFGLRADQCHAMTFPIQHALLYPERAPAGTDTALPLDKVFALDFRPVDEARYPCLRLAREAMAAGGTAPAVFNAANEVAVAAFLQNRVPFLAIPRIIEHTLTAVDLIEPTSLDQVLAVDAEARLVAQTFTNQLK
jgi:1-deoxy-D-xylulose-5-phosphate reductoisomerase